MAPVLKIRLTLLGFLLCITHTAWSQGSTAPSATVQYRIGAIDGTVVISNTNEGKKEIAALEQRFALRKMEQQAKVDELEKLKVQLYLQSEKMNTQERAALDKTISDMEAKVYKSDPDLSTQEHNAHQEMLKRLGEKMIPALKNYAAANGYFLVLNVSQLDQPHVVYATPDTSFTNFSDEMVNAYNSQSANVPAGTPSAPVKGKMAIINSKEAIASTNEGKKEFEVLNRRFTPRQKELQAQSLQVDQLRAQLQSQHDKLNRQEINTRLDVIAGKQKNSQKSYEEFEKQVEQAELEIFERLGKKMLLLLEKQVAANGYFLVLDLRDCLCNVLYDTPLSKVTDITEQMVAAYNAASVAPRPAVVPKKP